jgi:hypothetical protein
MGPCYSNAANILAQKMNLNDTSSFFAGVEIVFGAGVSNNPSTSSSSSLNKLKKIKMKMIFG